VKDVVKDVVVEKQRDYRIVRTHISRKPRENSLLVAVIGILLMFVASLYAWQDGGRTMADFSGNSDAVFNGGEYIRLFTSQFLHADLKHLLSNSVFFLFFSYLLFGYFGFWVFPVLTALLGSLVIYLTLLTYPPGISLLGASGTVYLMAGFWFSCYICIERSRSFGRRIMHVLGISMILLIPSAVSPQVSYSSHMIGFAVGLAAGLVYYRKFKERLLAREERVPYDDADSMPARTEIIKEVSPGEGDDPWVM
jgi:membrane associated rhomboid family serine protease